MVDEEAQRSVTLLNIPETVVNKAVDVGETPIEDDLEMLEDADDDNPIEDYSSLASSAPLWDPNIDVFMAQVERKTSV